MSIYLVNILNIKNATQLGGVNKRQKIGCHFPGKIHHQTLKIFGIESRPREKKWNVPTSKLDEEIFLNSKI
jgi:hypothetical protein